MRLHIPPEVTAVGSALIEAGFSAYLVGGCVRDLFLGREPKDWDVATDAKPAETQKIFSRRKVGTPTSSVGAEYDTIYENEFGTVGVKIPTTEGVRTPTSSVGAGTKKNVEIVEVTTFREEGKYTDKRHPDEVRFAKTIEEDLSRRDFTVNAMALPVTSDKEQTTGGYKNGNLSPVTSHLTPALVDPYGGQKDIGQRIIRTVGDPDARLTEDALRLMRAVRLAAELGFDIESKTIAAIKKHAGLLRDIAVERVRDELIKIVISKDAMRGIELMEELGLLEFVIPELREGIGIGQNKHHVYTVWEHNLRALDYAAKEDASLVVRMASLLHDVGKTRAKRGEGPESTFYGHEVIGARMAVKILDRLRFPRDFTEKVAHLVRRHMFYYNVGDVSPAGVRRFLVRVGIENLDDLLKVREADRIGSGVKKAVPYKLRHLMFMIEKVRHDPVSPKMLAVDGEDIMRIAGIAPSRQVGQILAVLLDEVLENPQKNTRDYLESKTKELAGMDERVVEGLVIKAKNKKEEIEAESEAEMKRRHRVE